MFFQLEGNHTLGREESRAGRFLEQRDFCKLHIISHYVKVLLGPNFPALMISRIGQDTIGQEVYRVMQDTGLDVRYVQICPGEQTMFAVCFLYPDGTGGNLSSDTSACSRVTPADISRVEEEFSRYAGCGIALAAPEIPLDARLRLLELGAQYQFFRAASFVSGEIRLAVEMGLVPLIDLLSINLHEAAAALDLPYNPLQPEQIILPAIEHFSRLNPGICLCVTAGKAGSWVWAGGMLRYLPALPIPILTTAGAGDAFLGGMIASLAAGLLPGEAHELARLVAASSVTSADTINFQTDRSCLRTIVKNHSVEISRSISSLLGN